MANRTYKADWGEWVGDGLIEDVIEEVVERFHRL